MKLFVKYKKYREKKTSLKNTREQLTQTQNSINNAQTYLGINNLNNLPQIPQGQTLQTLIDFYNGTRNSGGAFQAQQTAYDILLNDINNALTENVVDNLTVAINYFAYNGLPADKNKLALQQIQAERKIKLALSLPENTATERATKLTKLQNIANIYPTGVLPAERAAWNSGTNAEEVTKVITRLQTFQNESAYENLLNNVRQAINLNTLNSYKNQINNFIYRGLPIHKNKNTLETAWNQRRTELVQNAYDSLLNQINRETNPNADYTERISKLDWTRLGEERTWEKLEKAWADCQNQLNEHQAKEEIKNKKIGIEKRQVELWSRLESYFLLRELTKEDVEEIYGRKDFESIIKNTSEEDLEAGTSKRIFQAAVDIRAADKVLQTITDLRKYEGTEYSLDDQETQDTLGLLEKIKEGLESFTLNEKDKNHALYLKDIERRQEKLRQVKEAISYCQQKQQQVQIIAQK